jgi:uncharacterized protein (TIGR03000 family)
VPPADAKPTEPIPPPKPGKKTSTTTTAKVVVDLPAEAKLYVDDRLMKTTSSRRVFSTPKLEDGETYYYILRAEVEREGQKISRTKRVVVRAGAETRAAFPELATRDATNGVASVKP